MPSSIKLTQSAITRLSPMIGMIFLLGSLNCAENAHAQNSVGDALGKLIAPAVGPVLERAAGEIIVEGVRRGYENRNRFGRPIRRQPSPQPVQGSPAPVYQNPYPVESVQPVYTQPSHSQPGYVQTAAPTPQPDAPPQPRIDTRSIKRPPENASPVEIALAHVIADGPAVASGAIRIEAAQLTRQLDLAALEYLDQHAKGETGNQLKTAYRNKLASADGNRNGDSPIPRAEIVAAHAAAFANGSAPSSLLAAARAADASATITSSGDDLEHQQWMQLIDILGQELISIRSSLIRGDDLAVMAERVKNIRNLAVLSEIGRVLGVQRRKDILNQFHAAAEKSEMPAQVSAALVAFPTAAAELAVAPMPLPPGNPAVVLYSDQDNPGAIRFLCDNELDVTLEPGDLVPFNKAFVVAFQTGKGQTKRYSLKRGLYRWVLTDEGWDLKQKTSIRLTIDATHSPTRFHYTINGHPYVATEGETKEHRLTVPPRLDFTTGDSEGTVKSTLLTPGKFFVGANAESGGWDLYKADPSEIVVPTSVSGRAQQELIRSIRESKEYSGRLPYRYQLDNLLNQLQ